MIKVSKNTVLRHLFIWVCLIIFIAYGSSVEGSITAKVAYTFFFTFNFALAYYALLYFSFLTFAKKKYVLFVCSYLFVIVFFISADYFHFKKILPFLGATNPRGDLDFMSFINNSILLFSFVTFSALATFLNWRSVERLKRDAENEKNTILRELDFLKNQFNSHLTFNFLNFCYGKTLRTYPRVADSIEDFSEMLRYSLSNKNNEYVPLEKEIDYVTNFISIQKCITNSVFVEFEIENNAINCKILPMILAVFIENAFKHGVFNDEKNPIRIKLSTNNDTIFFNLKNNKANNKIITSTGIGLANLKQLLTLFYPNKHTLHIEETEATYFTTLTLKTN